MAEYWALRKLIKTAMVQSSGVLNFRIKHWSRAMKPSAALHAHRDAIRRIVEGNRAVNPRVFGSVARGSDSEGSDLDILVDPTPETTLFDIGAIRHELLQLLGVPVDVLTPKALPERSRSVILAEAIEV